MQRDGEKRDREQFMTAVTTHICSLGRLDVGGGIVGAVRTSDLAVFFFFFAVCEKNAALSLLEFLIGGLIWVTSVGACSLC